jgi:hypothetical protein
MCNADSARQVGSAGGRLWFINCHMSGKVSVVENLFDWKDIGMIHLTLACFDPNMILITRLFAHARENMKERYLYWKGKEYQKV